VAVVPCGQVSGGGLASPLLRPDGATGLPGRREAHPAHRDLVRPSDRWSLPPLPRLVFSSLPLLLRNDTHDSTGRTWPIPWLRSIDRPPAPCQLLIITLVGPYGFWLAGPGRRPSVTCRARASIAKSMLPPRHLAPALRCAATSRFLLARTLREYTTTGQVYVASSIATESSKEPFLYRKNNTPKKNLVKCTR
jgi:hypothetical protein